MVGNAVQLLAEFLVFQGQIPWIDFDRQSVWDRWRTLVPPFLPTASFLEHQNDKLPWRWPFSSLALAVPWEVLSLETHHVVCSSPFGASNGLRLST